MPVNTRRPLPLGRRSRGFSLIEVLVAMIILAIGLLGLASLQTRGLSYGHDAYLRSQATTLAYDITDAMRANRANLGNFLLASGSTPGGTCSATSAGAANALVCWYDDVVARLPGGQASITQSGSYYVVSVSWADPTQIDSSGKPARRTVSWSVMP